jgi:cytochrome d ubiquinol oxidase subunit I
MLRGRRDRYHRLGFLIPFWTGAVAAPIQIVVGDVLARKVSEQQPVKFAAMELVDRTSTDVPEWIGGIYYHGQVYFGIGIPYLDSILVGFSPHTRVVGWDSVPQRDRPPLPNLIHLSFDAMVMIGTLLLLLGAWQAWWWKFHRRVLMTRWFLVPVAFSGFAAIMAMEFGWIVTEVGRQPWVVYGLLTTRDALTTANGVPVTLAATVVIYGVLTGTTVLVPWLMSRRWRGQHPTPEEVGAAAADDEDAVRTPYGPPPSQVEEMSA